MKTLQPIWVVWQDAHIDNGEQGSPEALCVPSDDQIVHSVGLFLGVDEDNLYLGLEVCPSQNDVRGNIRIPLLLVRAVTRLGARGSLTERELSALTRKGKVPSALKCTPKKRSSSSRNGTVAQRSTLKRGPKRGGGTSRGRKR